MMKKQTITKATLTLCAALLGGTALAGMAPYEAFGYTIAWTEAKDDTTVTDRDEEEKALKREIIRQVEPLEKYGVSYDEETDIITYQGERVRWLVDDQPGSDLSYSLQNDKGTVDVYTVRDREGSLTGVRKASEKEFEERTAQYAMVNSPACVSEATLSSGETVYTYTVEDDQEYNIYVKDTAEAAASCIESGTDTVEVAAGNASSAWYNSAEVSQDTAQEGSDTWYDPNNQLYESLGMKWSREGYWTYEGKPVGILWIRDGSFTQWGIGDKEDCTYLYITRESKENQVSFKVSALSFSEFSRLYNEVHPESHLTR